MSELQKLTLFYDGHCPLCQAEILFLEGRNDAGLLAFIDVQSTNFNPAVTGVTCEQALESMYGQFADGTLIHGGGVFAQAYRRAKLPLLAWLFSRKLLEPLVNVSYRIFAKNRHAISRAIGPTLLYLVNFFAVKK